MQSTLKKVGFDCVGISSEFGTSEQVLSFNPDIVVACGKGPKVSTTGVGRRLKEMPRWGGKTVLIFPQGIKPKPQELIKIRMDVVLEAPVQVVRLIQVLANLTNQDDQVLMEKLVKTSAHDETSKEPSFVGGSKKGSASDNVYVRGSDAESKKGDEEKTKNKKGPKRKGMVDPSISSGEQDDSQTTWARGGEEPDSSSSGVWGIDHGSSSTEGRKSKFDLDTDGDKAKVKESATPDEVEESASKEKVDWSEVEKQLFSPNTEPPEKSSPLFPMAPPDSNPVVPEETAAPSEIVQEEVQAQPLSMEALPAADTETTALPVSETSSEIGILPDEAAIQARHQELVQASSHLAEKVSKYRELAASLSIQGESSGKRTKVKKAQKELMKGWKKEDLDSQDELRREFTKALFKKN